MSTIDRIPEHLMWEQNTAKGKNNLGKDDFMRLLLTQLKNQDPLKPTDHEQFAAQLAQFGSLEKLSNIESGIKGVKDGFNQEAKIQALSMIGKNVKAWGNSIELQPGKNVDFSHALGPNVRPIRAIIMNPSGVAVRNIDLSGGTAGGMITWDGKNDKGKQLPPGNYNFRVTGATKDGKIKETGSAVEGKVVGVDVQSRVPTLIVESGNGTQKVAVSKVASISLNEDGKKAEGLVAGRSVQDQLMKKSKQIQRSDSFDQSDLRTRASRGAQMYEGMGHWGGRRR